MNMYFYLAYMYTIHKACKMWDTTKCVAQTYKCPAQRSFVRCLHRFRSSQSVHSIFRGLRNVETNTYGIYTSTHDVPTQKAELFAYKIWIILLVTLCTTDICLCLAEFSA